MRIWLLAVSVLVGSQMPAAGRDPLPDVSSVLVDWNARSERLANIELSWNRRPDEHIDPFARHNSEWVTEDKNRQSMMRIDGDRFVYESRRVAVGPHGYDPTEVTSITASVGAAYPERVGAPYMRALLGHFADPAAEARPVQPFSRSFDGAILRDDWAASGDAYPRAVLQALPEYGSPEWAQFESDETATEQLQTLEIMAALLAVRPLHPLIGMRPEQLGIVGMAIVDGSPCAVMTETPVGSFATRTVFVDEHLNVVRRYIGQTAESGVQIDIDYASDSQDDVLPSSWTVLRFTTADRPVSVFARSEVACRVSAEALQAGELPGPFRAGTWVIDQSTRESYLIREDGEKRFVTNDELRWLPTYDELAQTDSGQVGVFIEERLRSRNVWQTVSWPLALAAMLLLAAGVQRWWRKASRVQS